MNARLATLLLIASAVILSFLSVVLGSIVIPLYRSFLHLQSMAELRAFIPAPTLFVCDHLSTIALSLAVVCIASVVAVWRVPERALRCVAVGWCVQWLVVWIAAFCFCYAGFLGEISMHHDQRFEFDEFLSLAGGVFPVSFVFILAPLIFALWPRRVPAHDRPAEQRAPG